MLFTSKEEKQIVEVIQQAEILTTGEIRIYVDNQLEGDPLAEAQRIFYKVGMHKTKNKNGILFYISENKKQVAVIGDQNIHKHVRQSFWNEILDEILTYFKKEEYANGIICAIKKTGEKLKKYFPVNDQDFNKNELANEILYKK